MSTVAFIRRMLDAGFSHEDALRAAEAFEATTAEIPAQRSKGAIRQARYEERKRQKASESVRSDASDETPSLPSSPQTPQQPTHPRGDIYTPRAKAPPKPDGFEVFWQAYPKRKAKDAAARAFAKAMSRIEAEDPLAVILAGIERALPGWDDPQFIPHPATWLNAGSWDDDAPEIRRSETRHDPTSRQDRPSKSDHLAAIFDAMGAASGRTQQPGGGDRPPPRDEGRVRALPPAA